MEKVITKVVKIYAVCLVYFNLGSGEDYVYRGRTQFIGINKNDVLKTSSQQKYEYKKSEPGEIFPEFIVIKINAFTGSIKSQLDEWIYYFQNMELPQHYTSKTLTLIDEKLRVSDMKVEEIKAYKKYHKTIDWGKSVWMTTYREGVIVGLDKGLEEGRKKGLEEGLEEGLEKGLEKGKIQFIKNAFEMKLPISQIAKVVEISEQEVVEILKNNGVL